MQSFVKKPAEIRPVTFEFNDHLPLNTQIFSATVTAIDTTDNSDQSLTVFLLPTTSISGTQVTVWVQGGVAGSKYLITFLVTLADIGSVLQEDVLMIVD